MVLVGAGSALAVDAPAGLPGPELPDGLGVNIHFTDPRPGEIEQLAAGGFTWVRMDFGWGGIERKPGVYDFSAYDRLVATLAANHLRPLLILDYDNPLYDGGLSPHTDAGRDAFCRWVKAALEHFRGRGIVWEMWNEPNGGFWKPVAKVEDYVALARAVGATVRATAPAEVFIGPATSEIDMRFLEACFKGGLLEVWDAVSVHPYRQTAPETAAAEYRRLRELIARYAPAGRHPPILSGEWGYSSAWNGTDEARQGRFLPRQWLTDLANEVPLSIWYDWHEDGADPKEAEHHFGIVRHAYRAGQAEVYEPKPGYLAARAFTSQLRGFRFCRRLALERADDYALLFAKGDEVTLAAWTTSPTPHPISISASAGAFAVVDHLGQPQPAATAGSAGLILTVSEAPLYAAASQPNELLRVAAACPRLPLEFRVHAPGMVPISFHLANPLARPLEMAAGVGGPATPATVAPGASATATVTRPVSLRHGEALRATWTIAGLGSFAEDCEIVVSDPLEVTLAPALRRGDAAVLPVRILNPGGEAFGGSVALVDGEGLRSSGSAPFAFATGELEKTVDLSLVGMPTGAYRAGVVVRDGEATAFSLAPLRFQQLDDFARYDAAALAAAYAVLPDGDPKVASRQTLAPSPADADPAAPAGAVAIDYRFDKGWKFLRMAPKAEGPKPLPGEPTALGLWIRSDGSGNIIHVRVVDSTGQTFQPGNERLSWTGWRFVAFPCDGSGGHWGGANDGMVHYPLRLDTLFLLDQGDQHHEAQSTVRLAAPTLVYAR
jgi:hypothetical protein